MATGLGGASSFSVLFRHHNMTSVIIRHCSLWWRQGGYKMKTLLFLYSKKTYAKRPFQYNIASVGLEVLSGTTEAQLRELLRETFSKNRHLEG